MAAVRILSIFVLSLLLLFILSCDSESPVQTPDEIIDSISKISGCGGFPDAAKRMDTGIPFTIDPSTYCNAERLHWLYDENTRTLSVLNSRVLLNCCGDHTITAAFEKGVLVIAEDDQPESGTGRCYCVCVFDFFVEITGISPGIITLRLDLTVDDITVTKWEGKIDLGKGNGEIIIDDKALENCTTIQTPDEIIDSISKISGCGGFPDAAKRMDSGIPFTIDPLTYCNAERLYWLYDENTRTLSVLNSRILLNCCGDHTITAAFEKGVLVIAEDDQPESGTGRCDCECIFDFFVEITGIFPGIITLRLDMTVDDTTVTKWEGKIDLGKGNGEIIIDDKALENCKTMGV